MSAAIAVAVTTVASTAANIVSTTKAANRQADAVAAQQKQAVEENRLAASAEIFERDRAARREQGRIRTAAGEAGLSLSSGSVEQLLMDSAMQDSLARERSLANLESRVAAVDAEANSQRSRIWKPTALGAGIQLAGAVAQGASGIANASKG